MSLYRQRGSKIWSMDFFFCGQRIRESTGQPGVTRAREIQSKRRQELRDGASGLRKRRTPELLSIAALEFIESKTRWSASMHVSAKNSLAHLLPVFGKHLLVDIEARDIAKYQKLRQGEDAANATINREVALLRSVLRRHGAWARIQPAVSMLPEPQDTGHALSPEEESALLAECRNSRSRLLLPFVMLLLETGARYNTIRTLQWSSIDLANGTLKIGKDKTRSGSGRTVPLSRRAVETLRFWAQRFPDARPADFVFPAERYSAAGSEGAFGFQAAIVVSSDHTKPVADIKESWEAARKRAGLPDVRLHDLRHSAVSRMIAARVPLPIIARLVGWSAGTMAKMAARYGHFSIEELRSAVESISAKPDQNSGGVPMKVPIVSRSEDGPIQ